MAPNLDFANLYPLSWLWDILKNQIIFKSFTILLTPFTVTQIELFLILLAFFLLYFLSSILILKLVIQARISFKFVNFRAKFQTLPNFEKMSQSKSNFHNLYFKKIKNHILLSTKIKILNSISHILFLAEFPLASSILELS